MSMPPWRNSSTVLPLATRRSPGSRRFEQMR
jgi:hypothetical protein